MNAEFTKLAYNACFHFEGCNLEISEAPRFYFEIWDNWNRLEVVAVNATNPEKQETFLICVKNFKTSEKRTEYCFEHNLIEAIETLKKEVAQ